MKKIALVTGGNRGIGYQIVKDLRVHNFHVLMGTRNMNQKEEEGVEPVFLDVTDENSIIDLQKLISEKYGVLDVLINNAAIISNKNFDEVSFMEFEKVMSVNVMGPFRMIRYFSILLSKSISPRIINVSSNMGQLENINHDHFAYRISKSTLNSITIAAASEYPNISINAIHPGWVNTDMGGANAPLSVEQGADTPVWLATMKNPPTGKLFHKRAEVNW